MASPLRDQGIAAERLRPALAQLVSTQRYTDVELGSRRSVAKLAEDIRDAVKYYQKHPEHCPEFSQWLGLVKVYRKKDRCTLHLQGYLNGRPFNTNSFPVSRANHPANTG
jgi:hypothetical protein